MASALSLTSGTVEHDEPVPVTRLLAEFVAGTRFAHLPAQVVVDTKLTVLDWLGSALAGALEPQARIAQQVAARLGASDDATVFPTARSSAAGAALANGVASHILELDDVHRGSTLHGAAPIIPAALATAERAGATGQAFLTAIVLGYDAAFRIGEAVNPSHYHFWHPTGTVATFGAAVAAGSILGLSTAQLQDALGTAGTQAAGLWEFNADGTMSKHLHPGKAAMNGVLAADLAHLGFTGAHRILEGERGFVAATSHSTDLSAITAGLGEMWKISENCFKLHACCGHTHTAIDIALAVRARLGWTGDDAAHQMKRIRIETYGPGYAIVREPDPRAAYQAKFSIAYCVAAALVDGQVGLEQFADARFSASGVTVPTIAALLERTHVEVNPAFTASYPERWSARVTLELHDGSVIHEAADYPLGNPEQPVQPSVLAAKFRALIVPRYGAAVAERAIAAVHRLDATTDIREFVQGIVE